MVGGDEVGTKRERSKDAAGHYISQPRVSVERLPRHTTTCGRHVW